MAEDYGYAAYRQGLTASLPDFRAPVRAKPFSAYVAVINPGSGPSPE